jgi:predicted dehydrogenase
MLSGAMDGASALIVVDNVQHMELHRHGLSGIDLLAPQMHEIEPTFDLNNIQMWRPDYAIPNMGQTRHFFQGFAGEIREFVSAILEKREPYPGTEDSLKAMRVIEAVCSNPDGFTKLS